MQFFLHILKILDEWQKESLKNKGSKFTLGQTPTPTLFCNVNFLIRGVGFPVPLNKPGSHVQK